MKLLLVIPLLFLTGCNSLLKPKLPQFPDVPEQLTQPCPELIEVTKKYPELSDLFKVVTLNYEQYYQCQQKVEAWNTWYKEQKTTYEKISR